MNSGFKFLHAEASKNLKHLNKKTTVNLDMPRSRRSRKNQDKPEWGKNNPKTKAKNRKITIAIGIIAVAAVLIAAFFVLVPNNGLLSTAPPTSPSPSASPTATPSPTIAPLPTAVPTVYLPAGVTPLTSPAGEYSASGTIVLLETSMGNITIQMRDDKPGTTTNFVNLVQLGLYDGTTFTRVIEGFMIQGGDITSQSIPAIPDEIGNVAENVNFNGTIAMAKTSQPNSATSQFFINVANNQNDLNGAFDSDYTVFGQVIGGMDVVMSISHVPVTTNPATLENSQPIQTVTLLHAYIVTH
jgi:peptidyl-prolyl cis-trans isomerase A (cyclophilin A)